jgi:hypothetical protein
MLPMKNISEQIEPLLFGEERDQTTAFAVLDGASVPNLQLKLWEHKIQHECLFRGKLRPDIAEVAPYLAQLEPNHQFTKFVIEGGWGNHWGIFALSQASLPELRRHFRTFFLVHDSKGQPMYFRYYDPRVLRVFLPTCNAEELRTMFGPVMTYVVEDEQPGIALRFRTADGILRREQLPASVS